MATYTVTWVKHQTLGASTVDTVNLGKAADEVEVLNRSTSDLIYFTADGTTTPTVGGDECYVVLPGAALRVPTTGAIKLISAGTPAYTVTGI